MAEPVRRSPLADLALPARSVPGPEPMTLTALPFRGKLILRGGAEARFEAIGGDFHARVQEFFAALPKAEPARCTAINAGGSIDDVAARIRAALC